VVIGGYYSNIKPIKEAKALIGALTAFQGKAPMNYLIGSFENALGYNSFGNAEVREQIANISRSVITSEQYTKDEKKQFGDFTLSEMRKEIDSPVKDVKHLLLIGATLDRAL
jgi:hypothetical protein